MPRFQRKGAETQRRKKSDFFFCVPASLRLCVKIRLFSVHFNPFGALDAWKTVPDAPVGSISEFKQLLSHRHWLAHGRYFVNRAPVPADPGFAIERLRSLRAALTAIDTAFPRAG